MHCQLGLLKVFEKYLSLIFCKIEVVAQVLRNTDFAFLLKSVEAKLQDLTHLGTFLVAGIDVQAPRLLVDMRTEEVLSLSIRFVNELLNVDGNSASVCFVTVFLSAIYLARFDTSEIQAMDLVQQNHYQGCFVVDKVTLDHNFATDLLVHLIGFELVFRGFHQDLAVVG